MRNGFAGFLSLLITIGIIAVLVSGGWYYSNKVPSGDIQSQSLLQFGQEKIKEAKNVKQQIEQQQQQMQAVLEEKNQTISSSIDTSTWKIYRNEKYGDAYFWQRNLCINLCRRIITIINGFF